MGFDEFWEAYPKNNSSKYQTSLEYQRAVSSGATEDELLHGATGYATETRLKGTAPQYITQAVNWLKNHKWAVQYKEVIAPILPRKEYIVNSWEERDRQIYQAVSEYTTQFMTNTIGMQSRDEGWELYLRRYVASIARTQAHQVYKSSNIPYDHAIIAPLTPKDIMIGDIKVAIPQYKVTEWQNNAEMNAISKKEEEIRLPVTVNYLPHKQMMEEMDMPDTLPLEAYYEEILEI